MQRNLTMTQIKNSSSTLGPREHGIKPDTARAPAVGVASTLGTLLASRYRHVRLQSDFQLLGLVRFSPARSPSLCDFPVTAYFCLCGSQGRSPIPFVMTGLQIHEDSFNKYLLRGLFSESAVPVPSTVGS